MEIRETSRTRSPILLQQERIGLQVDWLLTAVGRAYLAFCPAKERQRVITMLRSSSRLEDRLAREPERLNAILAETRARGYGTRDAGYTGGSMDGEAAIKRQSGLGRRLCLLQVSHHRQCTSEVKMRKRVIR